MKTVYLIGGTMGSGKTTVSQCLKNRLYNSVLLDGDWCWDAHPFRVTEETKAVVMDNICHVLNNFIRCSAYEYVIFCWVMHEQAIIDDILSRLHCEGCRVHVISLLCSREALTRRLMKDVERGVRAMDVVERSIARLPLYEKLSTVKLDVSNISAQEAAEQIAGL